MNYLILQQVELLRVQLLEDDKFMTAWKKAWDKDSTPKDHVAYAYEFERLMAMTPVFIRDIDHIFISIIDVENSTVKKPVFKMGKQICGCPGVQRDRSELHALREFYRCLKDAGQGTPMSDGRCYSHPEAKKVEKYLTSLGKSGWAMKMREHMQLNPDAFKKSTLGSLDREIMVIDTLLTTALEMEIHPEGILAITERAEKLKVARTKLEVDKYMIDPKQIQQFIRQLLMILRQSLPEDLYNEVMAEIEAKVPVPTNKAMVEIMNSRQIDAEFEVVEDE